MHTKKRAEHSFQREGNVNQGPTQMDVEGLRKKITRHILAGEISPKVLARGFRYIKEYLLTMKVYEAPIAAMREEKDFGGTPGLDCISYQFELENYRIGTVDVVKQKQIPARCVIFPNGARIAFEFLDEARYLPNFFDARTAPGKKNKPIATFTGTTTWDYGPNNGCYVRHQSHEEIVIPFKDTFPPGQRRGAIWIDRQGVVTPVDDDKKWQLVRNSFRDCQSLVGTSFWFTSSDRLDDTNLFKATDRASLSYFVVFRDSKGNERVGYFVISNSVPRSAAKKVADLLQKRLGAKSYFAAEMELAGSGAILRDQKKRRGCYPWIP